MAEGLNSADNQNEQNGKTHTSSLPLEVTVCSYSKETTPRACSPVFIERLLDVRMRNMRRTETTQRAQQ